MFIIHSKPTCAYCVKAKALLAEKGIAYREVDVTLDDEALAKVRAYWEGQGKRPTVPLIYDTAGGAIGGYEDLVRHLG